jgi:N-acetylmuramoyl-L-alanine amidase
MPAVLFEMGFMNHSTDRAAIINANHQNAMADAIVAGIKTFFGNEAQS